MKIKEFTEKYGVSYNVVMRASKRVRKYVDGKRHRYEFNENELGQAVAEELRDNIAYHQKHLHDRVDEYNKVGIIDWRVAPGE